MENKSIGSLMALLVLAILVTGWIMLEQRDPTSPYFDFDKAYESPLPGSSLLEDSPSTGWFNNIETSPFGDVNIRSGDDQIVVTLPVTAPLTDLNVTAETQAIKLSAKVLQTTASGTMQASVSHSQTLPFAVDGTSLKVKQSKDKIVITLDRVR